MTTSKQDAMKKLYAYWKKQDPTPGTAYNERMATFYQRVHGLTATEAGKWIGMLLVGAGLLGIVLGMFLNFLQETFGVNQQKPFGVHHEISFQLQRPENQLQRY